MVEPLRHRQTKGAETDMPGLQPPRHIPTLPERRPEETAATGERNDPFGATLAASRRLEHRQLSAESRHLHAAPTNRRGSTQASELWVTLGGE
jgi:hypothetical protein